MALSYLVSLNHIDSSGQHLFLLRKTNKSYLHSQDQTEVITSSVNSSAPREHVEIQGLFSQLEENQQ